MIAYGEIIIFHASLDNLLHIYLFSTFKSIIGNFLHLYIFFLILKAELQMCRIAPAYCICAMRLINCLHTTYCFL